MLRDQKIGYFSTQEFVKFDPRASAKTYGKIISIIKILNPIRSALKQPIVILSASRSLEHEKSMGRTGKSQHYYPNGKGAVDVTCKPEKLEELYNLLLGCDKISRVCIYRENGFIHFDFKKSDHKKYVYDGEKWARV